MKIKKRKTQEIPIDYIRQPKSRGSRVGSGNSSAARHPQHKVREITRLGSGELCGWSIYPEQIAPMALKMQRVLTQMRAVTLIGVAGDTRIVTAMLNSIGLSLPNNPDVRPCWLSRPVQKAVELVTENIIETRLTD